MTTWLPRGLAFAIGMVVLRLAQGSLINASPTNAGTISFALCALLGLAAFAWGLIDGLADARANEDPDRRRDLSMRWMLAGLVAGVVSGLATWIISLFYHGVYVDSLGPELIVFPAFTALLVFIPAVGDFINADYLGSTRTTMLGNVIQKQFLVVKDYPVAAALSFVLMALILVGVLLYTRALGTEDLV